MLISVTLKIYIK